MASKRQTVTVRDTMGRDYVTLPPGRIRIYLCGVTVYDDTHIGHARTIVVFDVLRRHLDGAGHRVEFVQNFTDIDDKIIQRARRDGVGALELAARYIARYHEDFDRLNVLRADAYPRATEHMDGIVSFVSDLVDAGRAYAVESGVYYSVETFPEYGRLSGKNTDEMIAGIRVDPKDDKRHPADFALWKRAESGPLWDSPWGRGRPGWHIECSAMSLAYLGEDFEIHGGGRDLIFPHHENEIAQSRGRTGKRTARVWMHTGMVTISGQKMSKSLGNVKSTRPLLDEWGPNVLRLFCLLGQYEKPIDYSREMLAESLAIWRRVEACLYELEQAAGDRPREPAGAWRRRFDAALSHDLNTHLAISIMMEMVREAGEMAARDILGGREASGMCAELDGMLYVLGLRVSRPSPGEAKRIRLMVERRNDLRRSGDYGAADAVRDDLYREGVGLLDRGGRTVWVVRERIPGEDGA